MSTQETLKRQQTINENVNMSVQKAQQIHDFLFGPVPANIAEQQGSKDLPSGGAYFDSLISKQAYTDQILNKLHNILQTISEKLQMKETAVSRMPKTSEMGYNAAAQERRT